MPEPLEWLPESYGTPAVVKAGPVPTWQDYGRNVRYTTCNNYTQQGRHFRAGGFSELAHGLFCEANVKASERYLEKVFAQSTGSEPAPSKDLTVFYDMLSTPKRPLER
jgi:hypothetical protein